MTPSLGYRIVLTLVPLLLLLATLGGAGAVLLHRLGGSIAAILRENYDSVIAMERLNEALERIDSSFNFALAGRQQQAHKQYEKNWDVYLDNLRDEQNNITLPGEAELVQELTALTERYRRQGEAFYGLPAEDRGRHEAYYGPGGLLETFSATKEVSGRILRINQENMEWASRQAKDTARSSLAWFAAGLAAAVLLAGVLAWHTVRSILRPIQAVTHAAQGIRAGNLDQVVPVLSKDE